MDVGELQLRNARHRLDHRLRPVRQQSVCRASITDPTVCAAFLRRRPDAAARPAVMSAPTSAKSMRLTARSCRSRRSATAAIGLPATDPAAGLHRPVVGRQRHDRLCGTRSLLQSTWQFSRRPPCQLWTIDPDPAADAVPADAAPGWHGRVALGVALRLRRRSLRRARWHPLAARAQCFAGGVGV